MKFQDFVCFEATIPEFQATSRDGAIAELVTSLDKAGMLGNNNGKAITRAVIKRENEASTGMGKGVAVPHVKHKAIKDVVAATDLSGAGIDFYALDKQPVDSVILLISPTNKADSHLQAMENIFRNLQYEKFRSFLRQCRNTEQIEDLLREADEGSSLYK